jgi:hypothetical protein
MTTGHRGSGTRGDVAEMGAWPDKQPITSHDPRNWRLASWSGSIPAIWTFALLMGFPVLMERVVEVVPASHARRAPIRFS